MCGLALAGESAEHLLRFISGLVPDMSFPCSQHLRSQGGHRPGKPGKFKSGNLEVPGKVGEKSGNFIRENEWPPCQSGSFWGTLCK